jgi:hypothetical protein
LRPTFAGAQRRDQPRFSCGTSQGKASLEERYAAIRKEIESARKDLRNGGWAKLYSSLVKLRKLGAEEPSCGIGKPFAK